ncbi:MAG: FAD-dependent oxidoreductase [Bacteroidales bacterium]|nr:FAD-dependent oxidoreductase [Bacteroidales bacterium]
MIKEIEINLLPEDLVSQEVIKRATAKKTGIKLIDILSCEVIRRSIDARKKPISYRVKLSLNLQDKNGNSNEESVQLQTKETSLNKIEYKDVHNSKPVIIIGAGPAGLFASLKLIEKGLKPIIIERGKPVSERKKDVAQIVRQREVNLESNWCFGEGGAGTFSDGKLYTRSNKRGNIDEVLDIFIEHGADKDIKVEAHAHIGTDKLSSIIKNIHKKIEEFGGEYHFNTKVIDFILKDNIIKGVITQNGDRIEADNVILATGHSARDIYYLFDEKKWALEAKPFAMGVRIEHPQELINQIQYHSSNYSKLLPPASYSLAYNNNERGVFSFCMCPGGMIIPASTSNGELVVNGMSNSLRSSPFANSGIVVSVNEEDAKEFSKYGALSLMKLQEDAEKKMFEAAGNSIAAPAQRLTDFLKSTPSSALSPTSYLCGVVPTNLNKVLPKFISSSLQNALNDFGRKMKGFITQEANLIGLESRTSSPVRIPRDKETLQHIQISGLYPCGEGAGLSGGITSSAIDGINIANKIAELNK